MEEQKRNAVIAGVVVIAVLLVGFMAFGGRSNRDASDLASRSQRRDDSSVGVSQQQQQSQTANVQQAATITLPSINGDRTRSVSANVREENGKTVVEFSWNGDRDSTNKTRQVAIYSGTCNQLGQLRYTATTTRTDAGYRAVFDARMSELVKLLPAAVVIREVDDRDGNGDDRRCADLGQYADQWNR